MQRLREHVPPGTDGAVPVGLNERLRFYRYDPPQRFKGHRDGAVRRSPTERSRLTFIVYLNDRAESGRTVSYPEDRVNGLPTVVPSVEPWVVRGWHSRTNGGTRGRRCWAAGSTSFAPT